MWNRFNKIFALFCILITLVVGFLAVLERNPPGFELKCSGKAVVYGNGVRYLPCTGDEFGEALSSLIDDANWREEEVAAITSDNTGKGYFVVFRPKGKCEPPSGINK